MAGSGNHKADCACPLCRGKIRTAERERAEAEEYAAIRAVARALVRMAALGPLSGPDALHSLVGHDDAVRVLKMAGYGASVFPASEPVRGGPAQSRSGFWSQFPDHDPDFVAGRRRLPDVAAEYDARQRERQAQRQSSVMWRTRDGTAVTDGDAAVIGASFGPSGAPVQRSVVSESVPPLGEEV